MKTYITLNATDKDLEELQELFEQTDNWDEALDIFLNQHELLGYLVEMYNISIFPFSYRIIKQKRQIADITIYLNN